MKNTNKLEKRLGDLEKPAGEENYRLIIYDSVKGAPVIPGDGRVTFLLPDNRRD